MRTHIVETNILFQWPLASRPNTEYFTAHYTGKIPAGLSLDKIDADLIDEWHKGRGWTGIGYHYVIKADATIERGRPRWAQGAHDEGENARSIGICVVYDAAKGCITQDQERVLVDLLVDLHEIYSLVPGPTTIYAHKDNEPAETPTECPGDPLYALLPSIRYQVRVEMGLHA